ncbi:MAG: cytochrome c [Deltaproteobacteria bacterium]|nr:cytochrome c [Deltaproteobacteria bacterium]
MMMVHKAVSMLALAGILLQPLPAKAHGPPEKGEMAHHGVGKEAMKAQHERMASFKEAADMLSNAIIHSATRLAKEGAEKLVQSLIGHERDVPHKNLSHAKEFQQLYGELGKRAENLKAAVETDDLPRSAVAYGRILEVCATCHVKFRD